MRKGRKLLLSAAVIAALGMAAPGVVAGAMAQKPDPASDEVCLYNVGDCSKADVVYVARQVLPENIEIKDVYDNYTMDGPIAALQNTLNGDNKTRTLKFYFTKDGSKYTEAKFKDSSVYLVVKIDNGTGGPIYVSKRVDGNSSELEFQITHDELTHLDNGSQYGNYASASIKAFYLTSKAPKDDGSEWQREQSTLTISLPEDLKDGDKVKIAFTSNPSGDDKPDEKSCVKRDLFIIENEFAAKTCECCNGKETRPDNDWIVFDENGYFTVEDAQKGEVGYSMYDACYKEKQENPDCCPTTPSDCNLFCYEKEENGGDVSECKVPEICDECKHPIYKGYNLRIVRVADFNSNNYYKGVLAADLDNAKVNFTLTANDNGVDLKNDIKAIYLVYADGSTEPFNIVDGKTAKLSVAGMFKSGKYENGYPAFSIKIVPKDNAEDLKPTTFYLKGSITGVGPDNPLDWENIIEWTYGANVAIVHMPLVFTGGGYSTYINLFSKEKAVVVANVMTKDGKPVRLYLGAVEPGKKFMVTGQQIVDKVKAAGYEVFSKDGVSQFPIDIQVGTAAEDLYGYAIMVQPGQIGSVRIPLFQGEGVDQ